MTTIKIQNLKCGGCAHTITKAIQNIEGVSEVNVDVELSSVTFQTISFEKMELVKTKLSHLGYPEVDAPNTLIHKTVSYVSCAVGKMG